MGADVRGIALGDRVGWTSVNGSYAEQAAVPADRVVPLPDGVDAETAAAVLLQGITAQYLVRSTYPVRPGDDVLVHAAAGGMGLLLTQIVKYLGGRVIGTTSTPEKAERARAAGADLVVGYDEVVDAVREFTDGDGVAVAYDGVGAATFEGSLASLRTRGYLVTFGNASGPVPAFEPLRLMQAGSVFVTRPTLVHYLRDRAELLERADEVLGWLADGTIDAQITGRYGLDEAARAHADLEARRTTGKLLIVP
jgi:NADPH2:quinone reductase